MTCWGQNLDGQSGQPTVGVVATPTEVTGSGGGWMDLATVQIQGKTTSPYARAVTVQGVARTTSTVVLNTEFEDRPLDLGWLSKHDKNV